MESNKRSMDSNQPQVNKGQQHGTPPPQPKQSDMGQPTGGGKSTPKDFIRLRSNDQSSSTSNQPKHHEPSKTQILTEGAASTIHHSQLPNLAGDLHRNPKTSQRRYRAIIVGDFDEEQQEYTNSRKESIKDDPHTRNISSAIKGDRTIIGIPNLRGIPTNKTSQTSQEPPWPGHLPDTEDSRNNSRTNHPQIGVQSVDNLQNQRSNRTQEKQLVDEVRESPWPGHPPGTEDSQNNNRIHLDLSLQTVRNPQRQRLVWTRGEDLVNDVGEPPWPGNSPGMEGSQNYNCTNPRKRCSHPDHQSRIYVGQPLHLHLDVQSSESPQEGRPDWPQDKKLVDSTRDSLNTQEMTEVRRRQQIQAKASAPRRKGEGIPVMEKVTVTPTQPQTRGKLIWSPHQSVDYRGHHNFHQNREGIVVKTNLGHPRCNYCFIPSHSRENCVFRREDLIRGIDRLYHPQKGLLRSRNSRRRLAAAAEEGDAKNFWADGSEFSVEPTVGRSPTQFRSNQRSCDQYKSESYVPGSETSREPEQAIKPKKQEYPKNELARSVDTKGHKNFWQTPAGNLLCSATGHILCNYCGIQSHGRRDCYVRIDDEAIQIFRVHHPDRGSLL